MSAQQDQDSSKPAIFILNLDENEIYEGLFDSIYSNLIALLTAKYHVQRARKSSAAQRYLSLSENRPVAILIVDPGVVKPVNATVLNQVKEYVRRGGTAVFMASFSTFIDRPTMNGLWKNHWGLDWQRGDYCRTTLHLNRTTPSLYTASLQAAYSQKALFLKRVPRSDSIYLPTSESRIQSMVFSPSPVNQDQTPVAFTKLGQGWLGYLGDVNNESGSQAVVMEICRFATSITGFN